ncbi:endonuclease exonuclease phosphatase family protein [Cystoisospora suis]|uniref:Endonuclease exonuclease phosphatase family protein n=1 Tax=Cystoisospora suis TaxID=483139 RepID=A0A2C6KBQ5_9APIC|nr:endonuclease exonuclease phosphatase family protein [Cystoisospora suis]
MYRFSSSFKAISHSSVVGTSFLSVSTSLFPWVVLILLPSPCTFRSFAWSLYSLPHQNVSLFPPFLSRTTHTRVFIFPSSPSRRSTPSIASLSPPVIFPGVKSARLAGLSLSLSSSLFPLPSFFSSTSYRFFEEASLSSPTVSRQFFLHAPFLHSSLSAPNPSFSPRFPLTFTATGNRRSLSSFLQKDSPSLFFCCERRAYPLSSFSLLKKASCLSSLTSVYLPSKSLSLSRCSTRPSSSSLPSSSSFSALPSSFIPARLSPPSFSPVFSSLPSLILSPCASPRQTSFNPLGFLFCQSSFSSLILLSFLNPTTTSCSSSPLPRENRFSSVNCQRSSSSLPLKMTGIPSLPSSSPSSVSNPLSSSSSSSSRFSPLASACASASHSGREMRDREDRSVSPHVSPEVVGKILVTQTVDKKVFLTFFWSNTRINMERSADESVEKVLQRLRISCQKAEQKSMKAREGGRKEKKRKQQPTPVDHDTSSSSFGAQRGSQTKQDEERTDPLLPYAFLRRRDGSVIPLSDPCGRSFREATFACFSTEMPSTTTTPTSSSSDFSISSGKQKAEEAKEPHVASPNGLGEAEQEEEEKKKEEGDNNKLRREQRMQIVWDPPIVKTLFVAQALYTGCPVLSSPVFTGGDESDIDEILVEWRHEETPDHSPPLHCGRSYTPTENDEGKSLKLKAYHPLTPDFSISATLNPVEPCPSLSWHKTRMEAFLSLSSSSSSSSSPSYSSSVPSSSSSPPSSSFRVCSFNILASAYAKTPHAIQSMYPYCHHRHLDLHHRKSLLGKEIKDLHGDIIALQEWRTLFLKTCELSFD